jgi:hypothetical protein
MAPNRPDITMSSDSAASTKTVVLFWGPIKMYVIVAFHTPGGRA